MCGILGGVGATDRIVAWAELHVDDLRHRGPDDRGVWSSRNGTVALGHRRLAVIDTSAGGHQPMVSADGHCTLVFNGEIYNFVELRDELRRLGHTFRSASDTEVVLASYLEWGRGCTARFIGMWAFALHDARTDELWMCRDPFGIKPLYWVAQPDLVAFASELPPLLDLTQRTPNLQVVFDYLRWGHVDRRDDTFVAGISSLGAGESCVVSCSSRPTSTSERYAVLPPRTATTDASYDEATAELRRLLTRSVELHLRSDVRVGAALSGGLDSSAIVMLMRELGGASLDLHTFSYLAVGSGFDETRWVDDVAAASGAHRTGVHLAPDELRTLAPVVAAVQFEPMGSLSIVAQYAVYRAARAAGVTVMLDGQGADELFAGYPSFRSERLADLVRGGRFGAAGRLATTMVQLDGPGTVARSLARALPHAMATQVWQRWMRRTCPAWLDTAWFEARGVDVGAPAADLPASLDESLLRAQAVSSLPGLLRYEDRNSMAHSIESRVPYLTTGLAAFAATLPPSYLIDARGRPKSILADALRGLVPESVLARRDKVAFTVPQNDWMASIGADSSPQLAGVRAGPGAHGVRRWAYERFERSLDGATTGP